MTTAIAYFELAGPNAEALARFYESVLGWSSQPGPFPNYLSLPAANTGIAGGLRQESTPECLLYFRVPDLRATLDLVTQAGGKVLIPPTDVPGVASFEDIAGNRVGLIR